MDRRGTLHGLGLGLALSTSGCLTEIDGLFEFRSSDDDESVEDTPVLPDGLTIETRHWLDWVLRDGLGHHRGTSDESPEAFHTVLSTQAEAQNRIETDTDEATEFVLATEFDQSYVIVLEALASGEAWFEATEIERTDTGIWMYVAKKPDRATTGDVVSHSLVVRVHDETTTRPEVITVDVDGRLTEATDQNLTWQH